MKVPSFLFGKPQDLIPLHKRLARKILQGAKLQDLIDGWMDTAQNEAPLVLDHPAFPHVEQFQFGQLADTLGVALPDGVASQRWAEFLTECFSAPWSFLFAVGPHGAVWGRPERHLTTLRAALEHMPILHAVGARFAEMDPSQTSNFWQCHNSVFNILARYDFSISKMMSVEELDGQISLIEQAIDRIEGGAEPIPYGRPLRA